MEIRLRSVGIHPANPRRILRRASAEIGAKQTGPQPLARLQFETHPLHRCARQLALDLITIRCRRDSMTPPCRGPSVVELTVKAGRVIMCCAARANFHAI